jgi:hypothetical protein
MLEINFSKGFALQSPTWRLPSHINRFGHPLILKDNFTEEEAEEEEEALLELLGATW